MQFVSFKEQFNPVLAAYFDKKIHPYEKLMHDDGLFSYIEHIERLVMGGGKRVRPFIALFMYAACGGTNKEIEKIGLALELFHTFGLMHDDIVDRGTDRHGVVTMHRYIAEHMKKNARVGDIDHVAEGQAIFLGDLILTWTHELWNDADGFDTAAKKQARALYHSMAEEVIMGQVIDIDLMVREEATAALIDQKMTLKTASYTFVRPMQIGATLAGANGEILAFSERFGGALGIAFQIQDDLFDLVSSRETMQKTVLSDLRDRQHTYFTQYIFDHGTKQQKEQLRQLFGRELSLAEQDDARALFRASGAIEHGMQHMQANFDKAEKELDTCPLSESTTHELRALVSFIRNRTQ